MKVLVIEDNKADQRLLQEMFRDMNMPAFELVFAENLTKGIAYLDSEDIGIVLLDLGLPESQGLDTFLRLKEHAENISVIVLTGLDDSTTALTALKQGAQDYLIKGWISTEILKKSIIYAIERQRLIEELRQSNREILFREERFRTLIEKNADAMVVLNKKEELQYQNPAAELLFEGAPAEYLKIPSFSLFDGAKSIEKTLDFPSGIQKIIEIRGVPVEWERLPAFLLTIRDITDRKKAEEERKISLTKYKVLFESFPLAITISDKMGNIVESNTRAEEILGLSIEEQSKRKIDGTEWQLIRSDGTPMPADEYASVRALKENCLVQNAEMGIVKENSAVT